MSTAPIPGPSPKPESRPQLKPVPVQPPPHRPRSYALWGVLASVLVAGSAGLYVAKDRIFRSGSGGGATTASLASFTVDNGDVKRTVRLSGTVQAERFAALMAPQLRGSRSGRGMGGSSRSGGGGGAVVSSSGGSSGGGSSSSTTAASASSSNSSSSVGSSGSGSGDSSTTNTASNANIGTGASSLGALRGSTNRFSDRSSTSSRGTSSSSSSRSSGSSSMGSSGLGSTGGSLFSFSSSGGGGGGGGRGNDFMLVLMALATPGATVKKGDVVAEFDRQYMLNRLDDYRASVAQIEADQRKLKADQAVQIEAKQQQVRIAKANLEKAQLDLKTLEIVSDMDAERLKLAFEEATATYKQMQTELSLLKQSLAAEMRSAVIEANQAKMELKRAEANADRLLIKAPMDGIVVMQSIRRGQEMAQVQQGDQIWPGQMFMQIVDPSSMILNAQVNQVDSESMRLGQVAKVELDAFPGLKLDAKVFSIGAVPVAGRRPDFMKQIPVRLKLETQDSRVIPDLSASADVIVGEERNASLVPLQSIFRKGGKPFVFLRAKSGWTKTPVELGVQNGRVAAVRSGVKKGDVVAAEAPAVEKASVAASPAS